MLSSKLKDYIETNIFRCILCIIGKRGMTYGEDIVFQVSWTSWGKNDTIMDYFLDYPDIIFYKFHLLNSMFLLDIYIL